MLKIRVKKLLFSFSFLLIINSSFSQDIIGKNQPLKFKHYSLTEGLSQSSVLTILQDSKGFLWFGTRDGLNKYDGHTFKTYRYNSKDSTSISNSFIKSLLEDANGNIWVGTNNGINKYLPSEDYFERFIQKDTNKNSLINNEIWSLASNDNYLWVGTNAGLEKLNIISGEFEHISYQNKKSKESIKNQIRSLYITSSNNLWICNRKNIILYDGENKDWKEIEYPETQVRKTSVNYAPVIYQDKNETIWLGYRDGLATFNKENNEFEHFKISSTTISSITDEVRAIHEDFFGNIWVGTYNGLYIINKEKTAINLFTHDENDVNSLSQNSIYSIIGDTKGDVWIGTYAGGINYFDRSFDLFKNYSAGANNYKLNYKVVSSIVEDSASNLWIGTEGGGLNYLDKKTGKFTYYTHNENDKNTVSTNNIKSILKTSQGNLWIGTHDGGLNFLNPTKKPFNFITYKNNPKDTLSLSNDRAITLFEDYNKNIWVGTSGGGLNMFDVKSKTFVRIKETSAIIGDFIYGISKTNNKEVLLISGSEALAKINVNTKEITPIVYKEKGNRIGNIVITLCAYQDKFNNIWIGTEGDGLYYYNTKTKKSIRYSTEEGLPNQVIYAILPDDYNNIWLSTNNGLSRFNLETQQFKNFDVSDGLIGNEFNYNAFVKLKNKELLFGGANGIAFFNPNKIVENSFIPPVFVTSITVNNKPYESGTNINNKIKLTHNQNVFSFNFIALSYSQSDKNKYAYKLKGFDNDWNYIGSKKSATYTNLDAGEYTFKVKASNSDGLWNEKGATVSVIILPAPWKTWWAYLIYSLLILGILLTIRRYSILRIQEKNQLKQERLEKEKLEEINQLKLTLFTNISHDFRTPLTLIIGPLERMIQKSIGDGFIKKQHEIMHRNASVLLQLINQLLDFRKSEAGKLQLKASESNIVPFIENCKLSFDELARTRNIEFDLKTQDEVINVWFDKINLTKVIFNILSNAFKFTPNDGKITIKLSTVAKKESLADFIKIEVKDSGRGIPKKKLGFVFDRFYQLGQSDENRRLGTGIGLSLTKNLIELHKGIIKVKSKKEQGTTFAICLPLGNKHLTKDEIITAIEEEKNSSTFYIDELNYPLKKAIANEELVEDTKMQNDKKPTLLLVEDNIEVRSFIKQIFEKNYYILEAENGQIALKIAQNKKVDLIISDVMMPVMNGIDLCNHIKTDILTSHIPVLLLTAKTSEDSQKEGFKIGADAYITKPFNSNILEARVNNVLNTRQNLIKKFKKDIILEPTELEVTSTDELFLKKSIDLIEENINNPNFTIPDFISEIGMSRSALYRKLKALTGQSITEFIRTIKLKRAAQLITQTDLNISEIAFDLGFNDLKHFRKTFKKLFNELPSNYRTKNTTE